jgi:hypothetical protein
MSTVSHLRHLIEKTDRRLRLNRFSQDPKSAYQKNVRRRQNLYAQLAREEARLFNPDAML